MGLRRAAAPERSSRPHLFISRPFCNCISSCGLVHHCRAEARGRTVCKRSVQAICGGEGGVRVRVVFFSAVPEKEIFGLLGWEASKAVQRVLQSKVRVTVNQQCM